MKMGKKFDVLVVGGGHAGVEAAAAAARIGARTGLLSLNPSAVGRMSCNPAIGGIGKGQLAREVDALGGLMGLAADRAGIQFRTLNTSKGRAVQSPRAQCDREGYEKVVQELLEEQGGVEVIAGEAIELLFRGESTQAGLRGVRMADGETILAPAVILTTGTFLEGILHTGGEQQAGGRVGEDGAAALGAALRAAGLKTNRLKTGTPPRIALDSVDFSMMEEQPGDTNPCRFSFLSEAIERDQISCWITRTSERTHEIVRANLHLAPMYAGRIEGRGPRYCPSIEDKIVRFADRSEHQVFLEPEGFTSDVLYANGISTSLPVEVQEQFVRTIVGMEKARIVQPG
jgi:tRNA uridine 5-carboxymethylaminomethyl modification enzyme